MRIMFHRFQLPELHRVKAEPAFPEVALGVNQVEDDAVLLVSGKDRQQKTDPVADPVPLHSDGIWFVIDT